MTGRTRTWVTLGASLVVLVAFAFALVAWRAHRSLSDRPDDVVAALSRVVGLPVEADGVRVTWWPPSLVVQGVRVPDASPLGPGNIIHADEARLVVRAVPLLSGRVVVKRVEVASPVVRLVRGVGGAWNFSARSSESSSDEGPDGAEVVARALASVRPATTGGEPTSFEDVVDVVVTRGRLSLRDRAIPGVPEFEVTAMDARLRRHAGAATIELSGSTLGGPAGNLRGTVEVPSDGTDVALALDAADVPANRLREVMQLARGGIPFGAALEGVVSARISGQMPPYWPPGQAAIGVLVDAGEASASMVGGYVRKAVGAPLAVALELRAGPDLLQVRKAMLESGDARVELSSPQPADPNAELQPALRLTSTNLSASLLSEWVPVLTAIAPQGELSLQGTIAPAVEGLAANIRLSGSDLGVQIGREPAALGAAAVAVDLLPDGGYSAGLSLEALESEDLFAHRLTAAFDREGEDGPVTIRVDGARGGRADAELERVAIEADVDGERAEIRRLEVAGLGGTLNAQGDIAREEGDVLSVRFAPQWDGLDFAGLVRLFGYEVDVQGLFTGHAALAARQGAEETLVDTLNGIFDVRLSNGQVQDLNLARATVDNLNAVPVLRDAIEDRAEETAPRLLAETTHIDSLTVNGSVRDGLVAVANLRLDAPIYSIDAKGNVGLDGAVDLDGDLVLDHDVTEALVSVSGVLSALAPAGEPIRIPVSIGGTYPDLVSAPSPAFLADAVAKQLTEEAGGGAQELLRRLFGGGSEPDVEAE